MLPTETPTSKSDGGFDICFILIFFYILFFIIVSCPAEPVPKLPIVQQAVRVASS